jgi:signal transduction histidine kinase
MSASLHLDPQSTSAPMPVRRGSPAVGDAPRLRLAALRVPLVVKVVGANLFVVVVLIATSLRVGGVITAGVWLAIAAALAIHLVLVLIALRPIRDLDATASRVWGGDLGARVSRSAVADEDVLRVGSMFNILLDSLATDRARMRALASEVIASGDVERAALARELHESTAQRLAALLLQLSAAARDCTDLILAQRLEAARDATQDLLEEVRFLSQSLHSRVLEDLGLLPALQKLVRDSTGGTGIDGDVDVRSGAGELPAGVAAVLYRVAQEAVRNAVLHGSPRRIRIVLHRDAELVTLQVYDNGIGFDVDAFERKASAARGGLASVRERLALIDGVLEIKSAPQGGTTIVATVPLVPTVSQGGLYDGER